MLFKKIIKINKDLDKLIELENKTMRDEIEKIVINWANRKNEAIGAAGCNCYIDALDTKPLAKKIAEKFYKVNEEIERQEFQLSDIILFKEKYKGTELSGIIKFLYLLYENKKIKEKVYKNYLEILQG